MSTPDDPADQREVLSSLPRSRRQRPSARREAARAAGRASTKAKPVAGVKTAAKPKAKPKPAAKPKATAAKATARKPTPRRKAGPPIPPAGYATPSEHKGSADPGAALAGLVRGVLKRLPF